MSKFVGIAKHHWTTHRPHEAAQMTEQDFEVIGQDIEGQVQALAAAIAGSDRPGEGYLEKVSRLQTARMTAESDVLREMLPESTVAEDLEDEDLAEQIRLASNAQIEQEAMLVERAWAIVEQEHHETEQAEQAAFRSALESVTRAYELEQADQVA